MFELYAGELDARIQDAHGLGQDLYGPQELAKALGISAAALWKRRQRGQLPGADLIISGVPIWMAESLKGAGLL